MFALYNPFAEQIKMRFLCLHLSNQQAEECINELELVDSFSALSKDEQKRFITSIEGTFRFFVLPAIDQSLLLRLYSDKRDVRPARNALIHAAAKIYCETQNIRLDYFLVHIHSDLLMQFAVGSFGMIKQPFSAATFNRFDKRLEDYNKTNQCNIWDELTHKIDMRLAFEMGLLTNPYGAYKYRLRMDSLMINSYGAAMTRLEIAYLTTKQMVSTLIQLGCEDYLPTGVWHYYNEEDHHKTTYFKGTIRELKNEGLYSTDDDELINEIKKSSHKRKEMIGAHRLQGILNETYRIIKACEETCITSLIEYKTMIRMFDDQATVQDDQIICKKNDEIKSTSLQNPYDRDSTCRFKQGKFYRGYVGVVAEMYDKEGNGIIVHRALEQNIHTDIEFMQEFYDEMDSELRLDIDKGDRAVISVDAGFVSEELNKYGNKIGFDIACAGVPGGAPDPIFAEFKVSDDDENIVECPAGYSTIGAKRNSSGMFVIHFADRYCYTCPHSEHCGAITTGVDEDGSFKKKGSSTVKVSISMIKAAICLRQLKDKSNPELTELINRRNAVEGIPSLLRRFHRVDESYKAGIFWARVAFYSKITGYNVHKLHNYLQKKMKNIKDQTSPELSNDKKSDNWIRYEQLRMDIEGLFDNPVP